ncbi:MAG: hypothetical protein KGD66_00080 [Candidatus Lokiarchaeota archaeon]|nr:hypothetical protein [Candidatus Lokiarchaeota archaeon]
MVIICIFYFYATILFYITVLSRRKGETSAFINNLSNSIVLIISITISLILIQVLKISKTDFIIFPFDIFTISFMIGYFPILYFFIHREKKRIKNQDDSWKRYYAVYAQELPLKYEIYRKLTHLVVLAIVFFYFTLGFLVQNVFIYILDLLPPLISDLFFSLYNLEGDKMIFTQYLVVFLVGISLIGLISVDLIRIIRPDYYPLKPVNLILREKEIQSRIGPHISMGVGCFSIIIIYGIFQPIGPLVICTSMTMSIFGDMASNLFGRMVGRRSIRKTKKTYEGLIAGMIIGFVSGMSCLVLLNDLYHISYFGLFILPSVGALIIGGLDFLNLEIDDNLSYNVIITPILFFLSTILI